MINNLMNCFFVFAPLWFYAGTVAPDIFSGQRIFMQASVLIFLGLFHFNRWVGVFLILTGAHWFIFDCPLYANKVVDIACGAAIYHFVASYYKGRGYVLGVAGILAWTLLLSGLQSSNMDILFWQNLEPSGMWTLPSYMGIFAAVTAPVMFAASPLLLCVSFAVLAYSKSAFAALAFVAGMTPFLKRKWLIWAIIALIPIGFIVFKDKRSGEWDRRLNVWPMVLSTAFRSPFFGAGLGNYGYWMVIEFRGKQNHYFQVKLKPENEQPTKDMILRIAKEEGTATDRIEGIHFKEPKAPFRNMKEIMDDLRGKSENPIHGYIWNHPHNEYLMLFFEYGVVGLWILMMFVFDLMKRYRRMADSPYLYANFKEISGLFGMLLAVLIVSFAHFPFYVPRLAVPIIFMLALLDSRLKKR